VTRTTSTGSRPTGRRLAAVDLGAGSGRVVLGVFDGERLRVEEAHRFPNPPVRLGGTLHWDLLRLYGEVIAGLGRASRLAGGGLESIGVDAWGVDFGLLDARGRLLANPVHYRDRRTRGVLERVCTRVPAEELFATTGIQLMPINTLFQLVSMVEAEDPLLDLARTLLTIPALVQRFLAGPALCEFTSATTTQCYDPRRRGWATPLLERLGVPTHLFPEVVEPGTVLGEVVGEAREELGGRVRVIAPATHDTGSAVAAVPLADDVAYISCGTWSLVGVEVPEPVLTRRALQANLTNEGGVGGTFRLLKNVTGLWLLEECRRAWARSGTVYDHARLLALAEAAPSGRALIDPDDERFAAPADLPSEVRSRCRETGQPEPHGPGEVVRVILESLALRHRVVVRRLEEVSGRRLSRVHVVGGGARNRLLCQLTADACGLPVRVGPVEATAIGNLVVQAVALGELSGLAEARELVRRSFPSRELEPRAGAWDELARRFEARFGGPSRPGAPGGFEGRDEAS